MSILQRGKQAAGAMQNLMWIFRNQVTIEKWLGIYKLNSVEIAQLIEDLGKYSKFVAETSLTTYGNWSHVQALSGYSIWKHAVSNFADNVNNILYVDCLDETVYNVLPQILNYEGAASSESASYFGYIYFYDGASYSSNYGGSGGDLSTEGGTSQTVLEDIYDFLYIGDASTFEGVTFSHQTFADGVTLEVEYWNGSAWTTLSFDTNGLVDNTSNFTSDGRLKFNAPGDWATTSVNSQTKYWIRISTTTSVTTPPVMYAVLPENSVITMLRLSGSEIRQENWNWCYYNNYIYVAIPNKGNGAYEGIQWLDSNSSNTNKENFFTYRNQYKIRFEDSTYPTTTANRTGSSTFNATTGRTITHNLGHTNYIVLVSPTASPGAGFYWYCSKSANSVIIYTIAGVTTAFDYRIEIF